MDDVNIDNSTAAELETNCLTADKQPRNAARSPGAVPSEPKTENAQKNIGQLQNGSILLEAAEDDFTEKEPTGSDDRTEQGSDIDVNVDGKKAAMTEDSNTNDGVNASKEMNTDTNQNLNNLNNKSGSDESEPDEITVHTDQTTMNETESQDFNSRRDLDEVINREPIRKPKNILKMTKTLWTSAEYDDIPDLNVHHATVTTVKEENSDDGSDEEDEDEGDGDGDDDTSSRTLYDRYVLLTCFA